MRSSAIILLSMMFSCSGAGPSPVDAGGVDSGVDAGPLCSGVPTRITQYTCVGQGEPGSARCEATLEAAVAAHFQSCDAGLGIVGHLSLGECPPLKSVRWTYGFPGDTYECFYPEDGGAAVGGINFSDHGVIVSGQVGDCSTIEPPMCRDGG